MNYLYDISYNQALQLLPINANLQLLLYLSTTHDNLLANNQYILECNYFRAYAVSLLREINDTHSHIESRRRTRRSWNYDVSGGYRQLPMIHQHVTRPEHNHVVAPVMHSSDIRPTNIDISGMIHQHVTRPEHNHVVAPVMHSSDIRPTNIDISGMPHQTSMSTDEFMQLDYIISDILMRDYDDTNGFDNDTYISNDVMRGLNVTEMANGLIDISYNYDIHSGINASCPIALDDFEENDSIKQIVKCGHIYKPIPIMKWFERHTRCPLCRHNLGIDRQQRDISFNGRGIEEIEREIDTLVNSITSVRIGLDIAINTDNHYNNNGEEDSDSWSSDSE
jgi:hypothetical protein